MDELQGCGWGVASLGADDLTDVQAAARAHAPGSAVISSCQRIEVYGIGSCGCDAPQVWRGFDALLRVAEVAAGLDSIVLGEAQILGQVRSAANVASPELRRTLSVAIAAARDFRGESTFKTHTGHLLDRALALSGVEPKGHLLVVGAGAAGRLVVERGLGLGFDDVTVSSRRPPSESWFDAERMRFVPLDALRSVEECDVVVTALGSTAKPLGAGDLPPVRKLLVDLGTPKNLAIESGPTLPVLAIADLRRDGREHGAPRRSAMRARLRTLLEQRLEDAQTDAQAPVGRLRHSVERIRQNEVARISRIHPDIPPETVDVITRSLVNQLFHHPTRRLRAANDPRLGAAVADLFAPEPATELETTL